MVNIRITRGHYFKWWYTVTFEMEYIHHVVLICLSFVIFLNVQSFKGFMCKSVEVEEQTIFSCKQQFFVNLIREKVTS